MTNIDEWIHGPIDGLYYELCQYPDVDVKVIRHACQDPYLVVRYGQVGPYLISWDDAVRIFMWSTEPNEGAECARLETLEHDAKHIVALMRSEKEGSA